MPSKKKKYNARFPAGRIKKIMQTDEEVGKVAQAVPIIISRTLELFAHSLLTKTMQITSAKNAKTLSPSHMKQCILSESRFDFLKDLVKGLPDVSGIDDDVPTPPQTPAPQTVQPTHSVASLPLTLHSDGGVFRELNSSRRKSRASRNSKDGSEAPTASSNAPDEYIGTNTPPMASARALGPQLVPPLQQQQPEQAPNLQIPLSPSFHVSQPNFYTEVNPINLTTNASKANPVNQPTSNFNQTATIDEDYDT